MSDQQPPPAVLSGQQIDQIGRQMRAEFARAVDDVELRRLAVDQAVKFACAPNAQVPDIMKLARDIYGFLAEPAAEIKVTVT